MKFVKVLAKETFDIPSHRRFSKGLEYRMREDLVEQLEGRDLIKVIKETKKEEVKDSTSEEKRKKIQKNK